MNLKQILKKGLVVGGLLVALSGFADANVPKVHADELTSIQFDEPESVSQSGVLQLGYDTNHDRREDVKFKYETAKFWGELSDFYLKDCAIDSNKDGKFSDDEWIGNVAILTAFKKEKENLLEVDPTGLVSLDFSRADETILLEYKKYVSIFDSLLGLESIFGGSKYLYKLKNYHINKMWPPQHLGSTNLNSYAFDSNENGEFSDDEWVKYKRWKK